VPTLVTYEALAIDGEKLGLGPESVAKIETVRKGGMESLSIMRDAGLPMAFGSDLLGGLMKYHSMEFEIRGRVLTPAEIIASATTVGAKLCRMEGKIGTIAPGCGRGDAWIEAVGYGARRLILPTFRAFASGEGGGGRSANACP
jgi:hypothetical protein